MPTPRTGLKGKKNSIVPILSKSEADNSTKKEKNAAQPKHLRQNAPLEKKAVQIAANESSRSTANKQKATDANLAIAVAINSQSGVPYVDNRLGGGALWVSHHQEVGKIAQTLKAANFRYHSVRGWWIK